MSRKLKARQQFLVWLKTTNPKAYSMVIDGAREQSGLGSTDGKSGGFWSGIADTFNKILPTITQTVAQTKIFKAQMKRAQRGLPPLKTAEYAPTMRIQADIGRETRGALAADLKTAVNKMMLPAALGIGGLLVLYFVMRKGK